MASEDVLERAGEVLSVRDAYPGRDGQCACHQCALIRDLAAEVRELRRDKARLDWLEKQLVKDYGKGFWVPALLLFDFGFRDAIDAAMGAEG